MTVINLSSLLEICQMLILSPCLILIPFKMETNRCFFFSDIELKVVMHFLLLSSSRHFFFIVLFIYLMDARFTGFLQ